MILNQEVLRNDNEDNAVAIIAMDSSISAESVNADTSYSNEDSITVIPETQLEVVCQTFFYIT